MPDNCLFADQAGEVFKILTEDCRPPYGPAPARAARSRPYSQGVKANVVFFTKGRTDGARSGFTTRRTNVPGITKKDRPLTPGALRRVREVLRARPERPSKAEPRRTRRKTAGEPSRFRKCASGSFKLDGFKWLKEESLDDVDELPEPEELATDAMTEMQAAFAEIVQVLKLLEQEAGA